MDPVDLVGLARTLVDIESTTGQEGAVARVLAGYLRDRGYSVLEQPLDRDRINVIAAVGEPEVVFSTHFDCVPPFFPSRVEDGVLHGRGACDAKGILAAQVAAAERLRAAGETRIGLVFVAGEERGSDGAKAANTIASRSRYLINGEPTELKLGAGDPRRVPRAARRPRQGGALRLPASWASRRSRSCSTCCTTCAAATGRPTTCSGRTHYTVGLISGGVAPNVIPPQAEAEVFFRTVGAHDALRRALAAVVAGRVEVHEILELPEVRLHTVPGFETEVFAYFSDVPFLSNWGTPLLLGPGTIHVAHTDREQMADRRPRARRGPLRRPGVPAAAQLIGVSARSAPVACQRAQNCGRRQARRGLRAAGDQAAVFEKSDAGVESWHETRAIGARPGSAQRASPATSRWRCSSHWKRATLVTAIGGVSFWASELVLRSVDDGACWILRTTSMPETTRPKAAKPWPSGFRRPPKSSDGWSLTQMNQPEVALSAVPRAIDTAPSTCFEPGDAGALERDGLKAFLRLRGAHARLDHLDLDGALGLVVHLHRAMEAAVVVVPGVHVAQEVGGRARRPGRIEFQHDVAERRLHPDPHRLGPRLGLGQQRGDRCRGGDEGRCDAKEA